MRRTLPILFCFFSLMPLGVSVCVVFAKPLDTAKIAFSANREGNRDIYLMNPDGSQQVNITNHGADDIALPGRQRVSKFFLPLTGIGFGAAGISI